MRGGMRYATPPPRLLIIRSTGEQDAGGDEVRGPAPPFVNYSFSRRTGPGENEVRNPRPPPVY